MLLLLVKSLAFDLDSIEGLIVGTSGLASIDESPCFASCAGFQFNDVADKDVKENEEDGDGNVDEDNEDDDDDDDDDDDGSPFESSIYPAHAKKIKLMI